MDQQKVCCLCGGPASGLGIKRLADGARICRSCVLRIAGLPGGGGYTEFCEGDNTQQVRDCVALMETRRDQHHKLEEVLSDRAAQFEQTRSFDTPDGVLIAVDDAHQLVKFDITSDDFWPGLTTVILAISELVDATAVPDPAVHVDSSVDDLPALIIPVAVSTEGLGPLGSYLIAGVAGLRPHDCGYQGGNARSIWVRDSIPRRSVP